MARGKSINLFLMDGEPNGRMKCSLTNWTGIAYKIPRTEIEKSNNIDHLNHNGVYFMFGTAENGEEVAYIGQARSRKNGSGLLGRILEPHPTSITGQMPFCLLQEMIILGLQKSAILRIVFAKWQKR